jgi:hypothetical protein
MQFLKKTMNRKRKSVIEEQPQINDNDSQSSCSPPYCDISQGSSGSGSSASSSSKKSFLSDREILDKLPELPREIRFTRGKGIVAPEDNKLIQFCVLGTVNQNWLTNCQYKTRTLVVEGVHVEQFYRYLRTHVEEFKEANGPDHMYAKCKVDDPLLILDQEKNTVAPEDLPKGERVLVTFKVEHWVLPKKQHDDFLFKLLSIRLLPAGTNLESKIYIGPDF